jgi:hypothetical protein
MTGWARSCYRKLTQDAGASFRLQRKLARVVRGTKSGGASILAHFRLSRQYKGRLFWSLLGTLNFLRYEDGRDDQLLQSSHARERDHSLVGCFLRFRSYSQLARGTVRFSVSLRPLLNADCQPAFLGRLRRRPWSAIHPRETAARLAYGLRDCYLSFPLRLQHRALCIRGLGDL